MTQSHHSKVLELFGNSTRQDHRWNTIVDREWCPFTNTKCFKIRKSNPEVSIGTCSVSYGKENRNVIICPNRLLERRQVFTDCLHLLTQHDPGNELHVVPEISIPGGSVDYFLVSAKKNKVKDFVAIEFQTLDTTGTVWPERQRLLKLLGLSVPKKDIESAKSFGMNWKMTAKTILVQLHHKVDTLEHLGKHCVLVIQDCLLEYLRSAFNFGHLKEVRLGDSMHIHSYMLEEDGGEFKVHLETRLSTDAAGIAQCLGIQANTKVELETIITELEKKISAKTLLTIDTPMPLGEEMPTE
jgi:hypothetical protein